MVVIVECYIPSNSLLSRIIKKTSLVQQSATPTAKEERPIEPSLPSTNKNKLNELKDVLGKYGYSGTTAYGIMNLAYYSIATFLAWRVADLGSGIVIAANTDTALKLNTFQIFSQIGKQLLKLSGVVWAGSQVTKIFRLYAAIALSPLIEGAYSKAEASFGIQSRKKLFWLAFSAIWIVAFTLYGTLISISTVQVLAKI